MKQKIWQKISLLLALALTLACLPLSAFADSAAPDGVKEDAYTDGKKLVISNTYSGDRGSLIDNIYNVYGETYYYWDDTYVYVWWDVYDPQTVVAFDNMYFRAGTDTSGAIYQNGGGAVVSKFRENSLIWDNSAIWQVVMASNEGGVRSYEMRFPHGGAQGFIISPVIYGADTYTITYKNSYQMAGDGKLVLFNDESTWFDNSATPEGAQPEEPIDPDEGVDGIKEEAYTDEKKLMIDTTYGGDRGELIDNVYKVSGETYYYWDDTYVYVWWDVHDPQGVVYFDNMYFRAGTNTDGAIYENGGGAIAYTPGTGALVMDNKDIWKVKVASNENGTRSYEFRFPHNGEDGFIINPVIYGAATYTTTYKSSYQEAVDGKLVLFNDPTTWFDDSAVFKKEVLPVDPNGRVDGKKDAEYTDEKMIEVSTAFTGQGGMKTSNVNHVYSRTYYYWDDTNVYLWWDVYDPDGVVTIDAFYYLSEVAESGDAIPIFQKTYGGQIEYRVETGVISNEKAEEFSILQVPNPNSATRSYEMAFPHGGREGFMIHPVCYINGNYTVSYNTSYLATNAAKTVLFADPSTYSDTCAVDGNVITDLTKLDAIKTAINRLPEDVAALTEEDRSLVEEVTAVVETVPVAWLSRLDSNLLARYNNAITRMLDLKAQQEQAKIKTVEDLITALPENIDLSHKDAVTQAKKAFDDLGDVGTYVDVALQTKLNIALNRIDTLQSPVKIDGEIDPAYEKGFSFEIFQEFSYDSASSVLGIDPDTTGVVHTFADQDYIYLRVEVFDDKITPLPEGNVWQVSDEIYYDGIITYVNPDPMNDPTGVPSKDTMHENSKDLSFYMRANGEIAPIYVSEGKTDFLAESSSFVSFVKDGSYGYETRIPRVEGEEDYLLNFVIVDPAYKTNAQGFPEFVRDDSRFIALGGEWFGNYLQFGQLYFEDYPQLKNYSQVVEGINALPDASTIENKALDKQVKELEEALALLNVDQRAMVSEDVVKRLSDVRAAIDAAKGVAFGDLNGDTKIDAKDALEILKAAVGKVTLTDAQKVTADLNGDTKIDAKDALLVLRKAVDKIDKFPVEE